MIVGVDEAGRGPLAGPVVAAAVALCKPRPPGIGDSKALNAAARAKAEAAILRRCTVGVGIASVEEIDALNIFGATMLAMTRAVLSLCEAAGAEPEEVRVDGNLTPAGRRAEWRWRAVPLVGGDARDASIGAASIIAKQHRDRLMEAACAEFPAYGFSRHKGYGTPDHLVALRAHGPCPLHRRGFAPVAQLELAL